MPTLTSFDLGAPGWNQILAPFLVSNVGTALAERVETVYRTSLVTPSRPDLFRAFAACDFQDVKVAVVGQDPYPAPKNANGMAFAVNPGQALPDSLFNIAKELKRSNDVILKDPSLMNWARQGVFLLNTVLTTQAGVSLAHRALGWQTFTAEVIRSLMLREKPTVWLLLGNQAKQHLDKKVLPTTHRIVTAAHPSPLSANRGFFGSNCFGKVNEALEELGLEPINWE